MELDTQDIIIAAFAVLLLVVIASVIFYRLGKEAKRCKENHCSFECSPGLGCHLVNKKVNEKKGVYGDYVKCTQSCSTPGPTPSPGTGPDPADVLNLVNQIVKFNGLNVVQDQIDCAVSFFVNTPDAWVGLVRKIDLKSQGDALNQIVFQQYCLPATPK
jgi:hypothetical protein